MQGLQGARCQFIGVVNGVAPAEPAGGSGELFAVCVEQCPIIFAHCLCRTEVELAAGFGIDEFHPARIGKCFLGRIDDLYQMGAYALLRELGDGSFIEVTRIEEIADEYDIGMIAHRGGIRQSMVCRSQGKGGCQTFGGMAVNDGR